MEDIKKDPFEEYIRNLSPSRRERGQAWAAAIGLQAVDGLRPSGYLYGIAERNIEGEISMQEAGSLIDRYYENRKEHSLAEERTEEADKVSQRISELLSDSSFDLRPVGYTAIHRKLFAGIYPHAGKLREFNIAKKEWVLEENSVLYGNAEDLMQTLEYDLNQERNFSYQGLTMDEIIRHLAVFISRLWQIHPFAEGNTRTTAVFLIKYLRSLGFEADNTSFALHSWYFRNALVRANYTNAYKGIFETTEYLERFLRNLLLKESNELRNRDLHISGRSDHEKIREEEAEYEVIPLGRREKDLMHLLLNSPRMKRSEMAENLGCSAADLDRSLERMEKQGLVRRSFH